MTRRDLLLAILAAADGQPFEPVQVQKATFLVVTNLPGLPDEGAPFVFEPYDYGPFDKSVYVEAEHLQGQGLALIRPSSVGRWKTYAATEDGVALGRAILDGFAPDTRKYVREVARWVRSQDFGNLVSSIYRAYPSMRANSVFEDRTR